MSANLKDRPSFREISRSPLAAAVRKLRQDFNLIGVVLIDFTTEHVGVCAAGKTEEFAGHMETLGERILAAIDDGKFDPEEEPSTDLTDVWRELSVIGAENPDSGWHYDTPRLKAQRLEQIEPWSAI